MNNNRDQSIRISVVIPCRNEISTIGDLIGFLLKRTGENCEIIVADGSSDDGTKELLDSIASREWRVIVLNNPRMHTSSGLNAAIRRARGEFIIRMDAHTRYADDYVEKSIETLEATGADNVGGPQLAESSKGYIEGAIAAACHSPAAVGGSRAAIDLGLEIVAGYLGIDEYVARVCSGHDELLC